MENRDLLGGPAAILVKAKVEAELAESGGGRRAGLLKASVRAFGAAACWMV